MRIAVSTCLNRGFRRRATLQAPTSNDNSLLAQRAGPGDRIHDPPGGCGSYVWVAEGVARQERHGTITDDGGSAARTKTHMQGRGETGASAAESVGESHMQALGHRSVAAAHAHTAPRQSARSALRRRRRRRATAA